MLLAVALLTDRNGGIDIDLPVSGTLCDPQFSVGAILWQAIVNLLGKALMAPFALSSGGGADALSQVQFQPGSARIPTAARPRWPSWPAHRLRCRRLPRVRSR